VKLNIFNRSQEWPLMEPGDPPQVRIRRQEMTRSKSADELGALYREMIEKHLLSGTSEDMAHANYMKMRPTSRGSLVSTSDEGSSSGGGNGESDSRRGSSQLYRLELLEKEIDFTDVEDNGDHDEHPKCKGKGKGKGKKAKKEEGASSPTRKEDTSTSRAGKEIVYTDVTPDQMRKDGFEIFSFDDGTVYAEVQFDHQVSKECLL